MSVINNIELDETIIVEIIRGRKKIYKCEKCKYISTNKTKAFDHMLTFKHRQNYDPNFKKLKETKVKLPNKVFCNVCDKYINSDYFETHKLRDYHIRKQNGEVKKPPTKIKCEICGEREYDKYFYEIHLMSNKHQKNLNKLNIKCNDQCIECSEKTQ